jgi:hypothetical protein
LTLALASLLVTLFSPVSGSSKNADRHDPAPRGRPQ